MKRKTLPTAEKYWGGVLKYQTLIFLLEFRDFLPKVMEQKYWGPIQPHKVQPLILLYIYGFAQTEFSKFYKEVSRWK